MRHTNPLSARAVSLHAAPGLCLKPSLATAFRGLNETTHFLALSADLCGDLGPAFGVKCRVRPKILQRNRVQRINPVELKDAHSAGLGRDRSDALQELERNPLAAALELVRDERADRSEERRVGKECRL